MATAVDKPDFCIEIDFKKVPGNPSRVFRTMTEIIEAFQFIDKELVQSVDVKIEPVLILEDIEQGSLKVWLTEALNALNDDGLKHLDWKLVAGNYLVKAKYILIDFIGHNTTVSNRGQLAELQMHLLKASRETDVRCIPVYAPIPEKEIATSLHLLSKSTNLLGENEGAKYITREKEASFNLDFSFSPEAIEDLLTRETIDTKQVMILKVKKPDYLGDSMWDCRYGNKTVQCKVSDAEWLRQFQGRDIEVRPGDAIRAHVLVSVKYGFDGEVVGTHYDLQEVIEIITMPATSQDPLF